MNRILSLICIVVCAMSLCACNNTTNTTAEDESSFYVYYLNRQKTSLEKRTYELSTTSFDEQMKELTKLFSTQSNVARVFPLLPDDVDLVRYVFTEHQLFLYFDADYNNMSPEREVLTRGGIVNTLLQLSDVAGVSFYVDNLPLKNASGDRVGIMTNDTFALNPGENVVNVKTYNLNLYFASANGKYLIKETRKCTVNEDVSEAKAVVEQLIQGTTLSYCQNTISSDVKINSITVMDGTAVVDFSSDILEQNYSVLEEVVIYSIVNSLTELSNVNNVVIKIDGENNMVFRSDYRLDRYYQMNKDLTS